MFAHIPLRRPGTGTGDAGHKAPVQGFGAAFGNRPATVEHGRGAVRAAHCRQAFGHTLPTSLRKNVVDGGRGARRASIPLPPAQRQQPRATSATSAPPSRTSQPQPQPLRAISSAPSFSPHLPRPAAAAPAATGLAQPEPLEGDGDVDGDGEFSGAEHPPMTDEGFGTAASSFRSSLGSQYGTGSSGGSASGSKERLFNRHPAHQHNMAAERESWRMERDAHEKKRKKYTAVIKDLKGEQRELTSKNHALTAELRTSHDRNATLDAENRALKKKLKELERALADAAPAPPSPAARPVLRDSDLLRQVRLAEARIGELEARRGGGGGDAAAANGFSPLLTPAFMDMFDVGCPLNSGGEAPTVNGAAWLEDPPDWHRRAYSGA